MPRRSRELVENECYHIYNRGVEKRVIFVNDTDYQLFLRYISKVTEEFGLKLFAYCLMGNHFHLYVQNCNGNLEKGMKMLQGPDPVKALADAIVFVVTQVDEQAQGEIPEEDILSVANAVMVELADLMEATGNPMDEGSMKKASVIAVQNLAKHYGSTPEDAQAAIGGLSAEDKQQAQGFIGG